MAPSQNDGRKVCEQPHGSVYANGNHIRRYHAIRVLTIPLQYREDLQVGDDIDQLVPATDPRSTTDLHSRCTADAAVGGMVLEEQSDPNAEFVPLAFSDFDETSAPRVPISEYGADEGELEACL